MLLYWFKPGAAGWQLQWALLSYGGHPRFIFVISINVDLNSYEPDSEETKMMGAHLTHHGDGVKDIAFSVEDLDAIMLRAKQRGCKIVNDIWEESDDFGKVEWSLLPK